MEPISINYCEHIISYDEVNNQWHADCNSKSFASLQDAKQAVIDYNRKQTKKAFVRTSAYYVNPYNPIVKKVDITSVLEGSTDAWTIHSNGQRERIRLHHLRAVTPEMNNMVTRLDEAIEAVDLAAGIRTKAYDAIKAVPPLTFPE